MNYEPDPSKQRDTHLLGHLAAVVDAVCQARLTPADVMGLDGRELFALYALGQMYFEAGQVRKAVLMWAALVALEPFEARAWRALGIGHQHAGDLREAGAAFAAAVYLEPADALSAVYAAEVYTLLKSSVQAEYFAHLVRRSQNEAAKSRLQKLSAALSTLCQQGAFDTDAPSPTTSASAPSQSDEHRFCLLDGRALPLVDTTYPAAGRSDATTLVADLRQASAAAEAGRILPLQRPEQPGDGQTTSALLPPLLQVPVLDLPRPQNRPGTGSESDALGLLPDATTARRMGRMLTQELSLTAALEGPRQSTQTHASPEKKSV